MKYQFIKTPLTKAQREFFNKQIIADLETGQPIDSKEIFQNYTGIGGLHGLKYTDFDNFHDFTEAKKEFEFGQFFTPPDLCEQVVRSLQPAPHHKICDFTCGSGNFFNNLPTESNVYGCEIEPNAFKVARALYPDAHIVEGDFITVRFDTKFDMVVGNPPFNLQTDEGLSQFAFMKKAAEYLRPGRLLCFLAPKTFLEDAYMNKSRIAQIEAAKMNFVAQAVIPREWFDVDIDIKVMYWQKRSPQVGFKAYQNDYVPFDADAIYEQFIKPIHENIKANAARLLLHERRNQVTVQIFDNGVEINSDQLAQITKYLYEFKQHKRLQKHLPTALEKLKQLKEQKKPDNMKGDMWAKIMLRTPEVVKWMKKQIAEQYKPAPRKCLKLVKRRNSIMYKAYDRSLLAKQREINITEMLSTNRPYRSDKFLDLIEKKRAAYKLQETPFDKLERVPALDKFLSDFELIESSKTLDLFSTPEIIKLNDKQLYDLGLAFQKPYSILNWQQGGGKSVAGMAWMELVKPKVKHIFIAAPSLAVQLTWKPRLTKYGFNFSIVEKWSDFHGIKPGRIILISFDMVRILQKHVKDFIKKKAAYNIALLVDESDELTNVLSSRTRAMQACFRKAKYKILTTGTTTRNNINELYPQLELLYNNSVNMICWSEHQYRPVDNKNDVAKMVNDRIGLPFPAWRGHNLFKYCHCPQKTTVFGIQQDTQDVYNSEHLKQLIDKTIITRTFDDIVGKRIYKIKTHHAVQNKEEHRLYAKIIDEFWQICYTYYTSSGNSRKEAMQRIIRQIKLLIESTSIPHTFPHYEGLEKPAKFYYILDLLKKWGNEKVAIGTVLIQAAQNYKSFIEFHFPDRSVFYIDGGCSFNQRKKIIAEFQATSNGVLISTQQSLKSSVDIETCNKCILESLQWNIPKMSQYYFRFIRYNSKEEKEVHFVTYAETIEQNILALLMSKEKLNEFVKNPDQLHTRAEIMEDFDIDTSILDQLIVKEYDSEGKLNLRWGKSKIKSAWQPLSIQAAGGDNLITQNQTA